MALVSELMQPGTNSKGLLFEGGFGITVGQE
jgi:hypothetical protein